MSKISRLVNCGFLNINSVKKTDHNTQYPPPYFSGSWYKSDNPSIACNPIVYGHT